MFRGGARLASFSIVLLAGLLLPPPTAAQAEQFPHVPGEVILKFRDTATEHEKNAILADLGATRSRRLGRIRARHSRITRFDVAGAVARYRDHPQVEFIEPNYIWFEDRIPDDPLFQQLWGLRNAGQTGGVPGADVSATDAWEVFTGSRQVVVAVIDTGVDYTHPDLAANIWSNPGEVAANGIDDDSNGFVDDIRGWDFVNGDNDPLDDRGHGTHVAGTIGAVGDNATGVAGMSWQVGIMPVKFLGDDGTGTTADAVSCVQYATEMGARIMNNSWGGGPYSEALSQAIDDARRQGVLFVAAAGNRALDTDSIPHYPASYDLPNIISVAATDHADELASFSNWGAERVDLAAPGVEILSTLPGAFYGYLDGTSMATPHVSGALALLLGRFPQIGWEEAKAILLDRVDPVPGLQGRVATAGRLNALLPIAEPDDVAPAPVTDLAVTAANASRVTLVWTASGDDGDVGTARRYDLRYSTEPIDATSFATAIEVQREPLPAAAGEREEFRVEGLAHGTQHFFAIRVFDELSNASPLSNVAEGSTLGPPDLSVSPGQLQAGLFTGGLEAQVLTLHNTGEGEAIFRIRPLAGEIAAAGSRASFEAAHSTRSVFDGSLRLLILASGTNVSNIKARLEEFPDIGEVRIFDGAGGTPSLDYLFGFDAVLVVVNSVFADPVAVGDVLADYADSGAGLVLTLASTVLGWAPAGRLLSGGYLPFELGSGPIGESTLGSHDPTHPILQNVSSVWGDWLADLEPAPGAELVASWTFGEPLVATRGMNVVGINIFVGATGHWSGDVPQLLRNAAFWSSRRVDWLSTDPIDGVLPAGDTLDVVVAFDASGLDQGEYEAHVVVESDDPGEPRIAVPASLQVTAAPDIDLSGDRLDFGTLFTGSALELALVVRNLGFQTLEVGPILLDGEVFAADTTGFDVEPGGLRLLPVTFQPVAEGSYQGSLTLLGNDPDRPSAAIALRGVAVIPPEIDAIPAAVSVDLFTGERSTQDLILSNTGGSELIWTLSVWRELPPETAATPETGQLAGPYVFHDGFEDGDSDGWLDAGGTAQREITGEIAARGTDYSLHEFGTVIQDHFIGSYRTFGRIQPSYIGFYLRSGSTITHDAYFVLRDDAGRFLIAFYARGGGLFALNPNTGGHWSYPYAAETWYHVEFREIDWVERTFDYWVDGEPVRENLPFSDPSASNVDRLDLYNFSAGSQAWFDEILISSEQPLEWLQAGATSGVIPASGSHEVPLRFDAAGLQGGDYLADIVIASNDPDEPELLVPATLHVTGAPHVVLSPGVLDYGAVFLGASRELTLTVANEGTDALEVSGIAFDRADFVSGPVTFSLAPGERREIEVTFRPGSASRIEGTLTLFSNDPDEPEATAGLLGEGRVPPEIEISPGRLDAGLRVGETASQGLTIANSGASDLEWSATIVEDSGLPPTWLSLSAPAGTVPPGGSVALSVVFDATSLIGGGYAAGVVIGSNDVDDPERVVPVALQVTGVPDLSVGAAVLDFGGQVVGLSTHRRLLVRNDGTDVLHVGTAVAEPGEFTPGIPAFELAVGESRELGVTFTPAAVGPVEGTLVLLSDDPDEGELTVVLRGDGLAPPDIAIEPPALSDSLVLGGSSQQTLTIGNVGAGDLEFGIEFVPRAGSSPYWAAPSPASGQVPPGEAVAVTVRLDSTVLGIQDIGELRGDLLILANDPDELFVIVPVSLTLRGEPDLRTEPASVDFGTVFTGLSEQRTLAILNPGSAILEVTGIRSDRSEIVPEVTSFSLGIGASRVVALTFTPGSVGPVEATLRIESNDPDAAVTAVPMTGAGLDPPRISVAPGEIVENLFFNQASTRTLVVDNEGGSPLVWESTVLGSGAGASLERVLEALDAGHEAVTSRIPLRWDFTGGETGFRIADGGRDMFDDGNILGTDLGGPLAYSDGVIAASETLGAGGRYFTRKYPGLFVLAADLDGVDSFVVSGGLGADGRGNVDGTVLETAALETSFGGFVKRVWNAFDPSVNHLIIVEQPDGVQHEFSPDTNEDYHRVFHLSGKTRVYYLLYAGKFANYIDDTVTRNILDAFLALLPSAPDWMEMLPGSGVLAAGEQEAVELSFNASSGLEPGVHRAEVHLESNDPHRPAVMVPVSVNVAEPPVAGMTPATLVAALPPHSGRVKTRTVLVSNTGGSDLVWEIDPGPHVVAEPASGVTPPGGSTDVVLTVGSAGLDEGDHLSTLRLRSNDPFHEPPEVALTLHVREVELDWLAIDLHPRLDAPRESIQVVLQLPADYNPREVEVPSVSIGGEVYALATPVLVEDRNRDGVPDLTLEFRSAAFEKWMASGEVVTATVTGEVRDRTWFTGDVVLRVGR